MWPWGHLAFGYLLYAGYVGVVRRKAPRGWPVVVLAFGTQFPDLVDKPLALWFHVLPEGRTLTHTLLVFLPASVLLLVLAWNYRRTALAWAFTLGWGSHLVGDSIQSLHNHAYRELTFLLWPVLPAPDYAATSFQYHLAQLLWLLHQVTLHSLFSPGDNFFVLQIWLAMFVFLLWIGQGMPPFELFGQLLGRPADRT